MIAYLDSSVLVRAYLVDESGHEEVRLLLEDPGVAAVTGSWTRVEVSGALVRAVRSGGRAAASVDLEGLLESLDQDLGAAGPVTLLAAPQAKVEQEALRLVRAHGLRAMDAWHLAVANLTVPPLLEPGEEMAFASRDEDQRAVAEALGFRPM